MIHKFLSRNLVFFHVDGSFKKSLGSIELLLNHLSKINIVIQLDKNMLISIYKEKTKVTKNISNNISFKVFALFISSDKHAKKLI